MEILDINVHTTTIFSKPIPTGILNFLLSYVSDDPMLFNFVYIVMVDASRPIGGVLFGLAFILVARKLQNREVKRYLVMTGIGFLLLLISYEAQALITAPFPPLGLLSGSYFGLASYTIFIGLYSSAASISEDSRLRASIRKSVESEVRFVGSMGEAEMDCRILDKVLETHEDESSPLMRLLVSPSNGLSQSCYYWKEHEK